MKFFNILKTPLFAAVLAVAAPFASFAESPIVSSMEAFIVDQDAEGNEVLREADKALPNQVIEYRLNYANRSAQPINGLAVTGPIPESTVYIADTAATMARTNFKVSIDDGETWEDEPVLRLRKAQNGEMVQVVIPASEYTHVRWNAASPLLAEAEQQYRYRVKIQ